MLLSCGLIPENELFRQIGIEINPIDGVRYTAPKTINIDNMPNELIIRFRVANVFKDHYIGVYVDDYQIIHKKRKIMTQERWKKYY
ncbi:hypothetical protein [Terrisporobacter vanillatitrophus]|uniref:hypothetical protein n=1 Tax=Terrisporobacter vanillatitrophus TaxID=3058402 RepID=UPI003EC11CB0